MPPTRADIAAGLGFSSASSAEDHLQALAKKGALELLPGASRGLRLKDVPGAPIQGTLPLVGRVAAGHPILAAENVEAHYRVDPALFSPRADYLLRVRGMSMKDAGILDGDLLAVHRTAEARSGQIVVARLSGAAGDEVTVKRLKRRGREIVLLPENSDFDPIVVNPAHTEWRSRASRSGCFAPASSNSGAHDVASRSFSEPPSSRQGDSRWFSQFPPAMPESRPTHYPRRRQGDRFLQEGVRRHRSDAPSRPGRQDRPRRAQDRRRLLMLADESPEMGHRSVQSYGGSPVSLMFYVPDVDRSFAQAVAAGARSSSRSRTSSTAIAAARSPIRSASRGRSRPTRKTSPRPRCKSAWKIWRSAGAA